MNTPEGETLLEAPGEPYFRFAVGMAAGLISVLAPLCFILGRSHYGLLAFLFFIPICIGGGIVCIVVRRTSGIKYVLQSNCLSVFKGAHLTKTVPYKAIVGIIQYKSGLRLKIIGGRRDLVLYTGRSTEEFIGELRRLLECSQAEK